MSPRSADIYTSPAIRNLWCQSNPQNLACADVSVSLRHDHADQRGIALNYYLLFPKQKSTQRSNTIFPAATPPVTILPRKKYVPAGSPLRSNRQAKPVGGAGATTCFSICPKKLKISTSQSGAAETF